MARYRSRGRTFGLLKEIKRKALKKEVITVTRSHSVTKYKMLKYGHPYSRKTATRYDTASPTKKPVKGGNMCGSSPRPRPPRNGMWLRGMVTRSMQAICETEARVCWKVESLSGTKESSGRGAERLDEKASVLRALNIVQAVPLIEIEGL
jgi:hypothetical protein